MSSARRQPWLGLVLLAAACAWPFALLAEDRPDGRALFQGHVAFAAGLRATQLRLPVAYAACANCHGDRGRGGREGALIAPAIDWQTLHTLRGAEGAYASDEAIVTAVTDGIGRGGRTLSAAMPRYRIQADEAQALVSYLKRVGTRDDQPPGATQRTLRLGTALPLSGAGSPIGREVLAGLNDVFEAANADGGIHGRILTLEAADTGGGGLQGALAKITAEPIYALVGSLWSGSEVEAERLLSARRIASIGSLVVREKAAEAGEWVLHLLPPLETQQQALEGALRSCQGERWGLAITATSPLDPSSEIRWLTRNELSEFVQTPAIRRTCLGLGAMAAADIPGLNASGLRTLVVLPFPAEVLSPGEDNEDRVNHWRRLGRASARLTVELLAEAGPALTERSMLQAAQSLRGFRPISNAPPVSFSQGRRFGWDPSIVAWSVDRIASP